MDRPWFQFHTRDWLDNKELRRCSPAARAILTDLMCLAHEGAAYGFLEDNIGYLTVRFMASRCCVTLAVFRKAWAELIQAERIHESDIDPGRFYIKRMVEDERVRLLRAAGGSLGGNPSIPRKVNLPSNLSSSREVNRPLARAHVPRSGSDSGSDSDSSEEVNQNSERARELVPIPDFGPEFQRVIGAFLAAGVKLSEQDTYQAAQEWASLLTPESRFAAAQCAEVRAKSNEARFMGLPANFIRKREWTRRGPGRLIPEPRVASKGEISQEIAGRNFLKKRGVEA